jgi:hypothetical protein
MKKIFIKIAEELRRIIPCLLFGFSLTRILEFREYSYIFVLIVSIISFINEIVVGILEEKK